MFYSKNDIENINKMKRNFSEKKIARIVEKQDTLNISEELKSTLQKIRQNGGNLEDVNKEVDKEIYVDLPDIPFITLEGGAQPNTLAPNTEMVNAFDNVNPYMPNPQMPNPYQQIPMMPPQQEIPIAPQMPMMPPQMQPYQELPQAPYNQMPYQQMPMMPPQMPYQQMPPQMPYQELPQMPYGQPYLPMKNENQEQKDTSDLIN